MEHRLKIQNQFFLPVIRGTKQFEIRKNDRDFKVGDTVVLEEIDENNQYTGNCFASIITYITNFQQKEGYVVFGLSRGSNFIDYGLIS